MAGLNDDLEEDFIDQPTNNPDASPEKTVLAIIPDSDMIATTEVIPSSTELFGADTPPGELPNLKTEFAIINTRKNSLSDFSSSVKEIASRSVISKGGAELLISVESDFSDRINPIGYYTNEPSKTQFDNTLVQANKFLKEEYIKLDNQYSIVISKLLNAIDDCRDDLKYTKERTDDTLDKINNFIKFKWFNKIVPVSRKFYMTSTHKLSNLLEENLDDIDIKFFTTSIDLTNSIHNLKEVINNNKSFPLELNGKQIKIIPTGECSINSLVETYSNSSENPVGTILDELAVLRLSINSDLDYSSDSNYQNNVDVLISCKNRANVYDEFNNSLLELLNILYRKVT